jgi:DNA-binding IclR family transcriptional regulator
MAKERSGEVLRSAERLLNVLEWFNFERPQGTIAQISADLELAASTVRRLLLVLRDHALVDADAEGRYRLAWGVMRLASILRGTNEIVRVSSAELNAVHHATNETVALSVLEADSILHLDAREAADLPELYRPIGYRWKAYDGGATGRALLAWVSEERLNECLPDAPEWGPEGKARLRLEEDLARVREAGFAQNDAERNPLVWSLAAPIRDQTGNVQAALAVTINRFGLTDEVAETASRLCRASANRISIALGWNPPGEA